MTAAQPHDASRSLLGYMQQLRYSLWQAIEGAKDNILGMVAIEAADDVEIMGPEEHRVEQLKHRDSLSSLTDRSSDLWKTLRIWAGIARNPTFDITGVQFRLITTGTVPDGSVGALLSGTSRDPHQAWKKLKQIASETNLTNQKAYDAFSQLSQPLQQQLVSQIEIIAESPDIYEVRQKIHASLALGFPRQHLETFASNLEGWWFNLCISKLSDERDRFIRFDQLDAQIQSLRDEFSEDNLPISDKIANMTAPTVRYQNHDFVEQLRFIKVSESRIERAINNYLRAFNQRSAWQRDNLLLYRELEKYGIALKEEWNIYFDQLQDSLGVGATEEAKLSAARNLYNWAEGATAPVIRDRCTAPFVVRGSLQILAHEHEIGWHPEFAEKLLELLTTRDGAVK
ncbi:hypothetical protein LOC59_00415 [Arthrobacter sp. zg-Y916]|uniref:ABC-three component system protein n=1 Tax=Arthrobacter sp. zg-Y916 TaxID=2894190 RepID=UPI001E2A0EE9|nr:ABC-three component system protein [Arthrobacter sp. zg-Y916]MCC9192118.1 hypothetical protein [Arthrobacter sp. zg-Y916]